MTTERRPARSLKGEINELTRGDGFTGKAGRCCTRRFPGTVRCNAHARVVRPSVWAARLAERVGPEEYGRLRPHGLLGASSRRWCVGGDDGTVGPRTSRPLG